MPLTRSLGLRLSLTGTTSWIITEIDRQTVTDRLGQTDIVRPCFEADRP